MADSIRLSDGEDDYVSFCRAMRIPEEPRPEDLVEVTLVGGRKVQMRRGGVEKLAVPNRWAAFTTDELQALMEAIKAGFPLGDPDVSYMPGHEAVAEFVAELERRKP